MPQTTNTEPKACARIDIAIDSDCASWTNVSGSSNSVQNTTQNKAVADEYTFDGETAISESGKRQPVDLTFRIAFTNVPTEAYRIVRDRFLAASCDGKLCVRWIPNGNVGDDGFQTNYAPVTQFSWPDVDAGGAGPIFTTFVVHAADVDPFVFVS